MKGLNLQSNLTRIFLREQFWKTFCLNRRSLELGRAAPQGPKVLMEEGPLTFAMMSASSSEKAPEPYEHFGICKQAVKEGLDVRERPRPPKFSNKTPRFIMFPKWSY